MQSQYLQVMQDMARLAVLAGCAAMASGSSKPRVNALPAVKELENPPEQREISPEVLEFTKYPRHFQRQMLDYGRRYINANFEAKNLTKPK